MIKLFGNWFSPFARKVALILEYKELEFEFIDGLARNNHDALKSFNARAEVPTLVDDSLVVSQSSQIAAYLEEAYPTHAVFPIAPKDRVVARHIEYLFDTVIDAALVNNSLWNWTNRDDSRPEGMLEAAQVDVTTVLEKLEDVLHRSNNRFMFGTTPSIVEFTAWPHLIALKPLGLTLDKNLYPTVDEWMHTMRALPLFKDDISRTTSLLRSMTDDTHERTKIAWRGDRIEWMLAHGYHDWLLNEIRQDRVIWPL